jgi:uncharacterized protein (TIGR02246 family)
MRRCFFAFLLLTGTLWALPAQTAVADEIGNIREEWARDLHDKQLDRIMKLYAPDAVFLSPDGSRVTREAAIRELMKKVMSAVTSNIALSGITTESSGNLAYDSGSYKETLVPTAGGPSQEMQGHYVIVFKRQADGKWRIIQQVWTVVGAPEIPAIK